MLFGPAVTLLGLFGIDLRFPNEMSLLRLIPLLAGERVRGGVTIADVLLVIVPPILISVPSLSLITCRFWEFLSGEEEGTFELLAGGIGGELLAGGIGGRFLCGCCVVLEGLVVMLLLPVLLSSTILLVVLLLVAFNSLAAPGDDSWIEAGIFLEGVTEVSPRWVEGVTEVSPR